MKNLRVLITAGPTREYWDPVRFLTNGSSGILGQKIAESFNKNGARVTLVLGPSSLRVSPKIKTIRVVSALQMYSAVKKNIAKADVFIASAAVGDWRFKKIQRNKIKKGHQEIMRLSLVRNPDILAQMGKLNKKRKPPLLIIGFALETVRLEGSARKKMFQKNLDLIIANTPDSFSSSSIKSIWLERSGQKTNYPTMNKGQLANQLVRWVRKNYDN